MKFDMKNFYFTALHIAAENGFADIVELLFTHDDLHINAQTIFKLIFFLMEFIKTILISFQSKN